MSRPRNTTNPKVRAQWLPIAHAIMAARRRTGFTQRELAAKIGIDVSTLAHYELGTRSVPRNRVVACSQILDEPQLLEMVLTRHASARPYKERTITAEAGVFGHAKFALWWASQTVALIDRFDLTLPDLDACRDRVFAWTRELIAVRQLDVATCPIDTAIELASSFQPAIEAGFADRRRAAAAA